MFVLLIHSFIHLFEQIPRIYIQGKEFTFELVYHTIYLIFFFRDIGIEAIKRAGFAKFVDVRHLEGYPEDDSR